ncbi:adenosylcobinamide-phosphate synthase CbiB [Comamonas sp. NLF-1-9]|uniref:adenosylcobinamide-phosphate synthase CbiB n=1 Tax=Comamonas sp. NLF-1-9 TaxID=2853163 RepID=UPI001C484B84|nr:adenosylcobinamide-phosphate synthase CbiB [Comamonas sp. NLF-1-9]QXL83179.1 adenosylcobinamide-phosphate synthase CbiB [Comamonas sp. NLF-1-9]
MIFFSASPASLAWLALVPALALVIDRSLGEPAARWHPVVWMGRYLAWAGARVAPPADLPEAGRAPVFWRGAAAWCLGALAVTTLAFGLQTGVLRLPDWAGALLLALLLKPLLAWALLHDEVLAVEQALARSLADGRAQLARLVSRDVSALSEAEVRESAIESLAENLNDSLVAPLLWFMLLGLPGAALFRFANTADAMWGYRGARSLAGVARDWTWAGRWAARADDVLAWLPARITAVLLVALGVLRDWRQLPTQARRTPSPNGGWPMAAMALALGVRLGKPGVYRLNETGRSPQPADLLRACALGSRVAIAATLLTCAALLAGAAPW